VNSLGDVAKRRSYFTVKPIEPERAPLNDVEPLRCFTTASHSLRIKGLYLTVRGGSGKNLLVSRLHSRAMQAMSNTSQRQTGNPAAVVVLCRTGHARKVRRLQGIELELEPVLRGACVTE